MQVRLPELGQVEEPALLAQTPWVEAWAFSQRAEEVVEQQLVAAGAARMSVAPARRQLAVSAMELAALAVAELERYWVSGRVAPRSEEAPTSGVAQAG